MSDGGFVLAGYAIVFGGIGGYVLRLVWRGRALSRQVPPGERRWT